MTTKYPAGTTLLGPPMDLAAVVVAEGHGQFHWWHPYSGECCEDDTGTAEQAKKITLDWNDAGDEAGFFRQVRGTCRACAKEVPWEDVEFPLAAKPDASGLSKDFFLEMDEEERGGALGIRRQVVEAVRHGEAVATAVMAGLREVEMDLRPNFGWGEMMPYKDRPSWWVTLAIKGAERQVAYLEANPPQSSSDNS